MYNLYFLNYKNYYNRQVKRLSNLEDYLTEDYLLYTLRNTNFKPDNWINTKHVINTNITPNYLIAEDLDDGSFTRWFVIESNKLRNGQYSLSLLRDVVCDELKNVLTSTSYIEKGYVENTNPLVLNEEQFTCNQIKQKEIQLYDKSGIPWVAIYFNKTELAETQTFTMNPFLHKIDYNIESVDIETALHSIDSQLGTLYNKNISFSISNNDYDIIKRDKQSLLNLINRYEGKYFTFNEINTENRYGYKIHFEKFYLCDGVFGTKNLGEEIYRLYLLKVYDNTDLYSFYESYRTMSFSGTLENVLFLPYSDMIIDKNYINEIIISIQENLGNSTISDIQLLPFNPVFNGIGINRYLLSNDLSFDILDDYGIYFDDESLTLYTSPTLNEKKPIKGSKYFNYTYLYTFNISIPYFLYYNNKILKNCFDFRLCSPNYSSVFNFNYSDFLNEINNDGINLIEFNVDIQYKPFQPYIHVNPIFKGIYGYDFNDARGLICSGDFSLEQFSDAWANYQRQNSTYSQQFDRQIENMEFNRKFERMSYISGAIGGVATGDASDAIVGGLPGAIVGGAVSAAAGVADIVMSELQYNETLDYTKDMYNYNLQNIQALPNTITKVSAINNNNKNVPFLEIYTCSEQELKAFENKIKYNGMTINVLGELKDYILNSETEETYVKAKMVRINDERDYYFGRILANEVNQGFFIKPSDYEDLEI